MMTKNFNKRLVLNKKTISNLSAENMSNIRGQGVTVTCTCGTSVGPDCTLDPECTNIACQTYETVICCTESAGGTSYDQYCTGDCTNNC